MSYARLPCTSARSPLGSALFQGAYRSRAATMLLAAGGMAFSLFVGSLAGDHPATLGDAAVRGLLVLAGGLFQTLLVVSLCPLRRFSAERQVIAHVYESLADYADALSESESTPAPPEPHTLARVSAVHKDPQPFARSSERLVFRGLLDEAERIRASLTALSLDGLLPSNLSASVSIEWRKTS